MPPTLRVLLFLALLLSAVSLRGEPEDTLSVGQLFHHGTSYDEDGLKGENLTWGKEMPLYKQYPEALRTMLPRPLYRGMTVETAIAGRKSVRSFSDRAITLEQLSNMLHSAYGITHSWSGYDFRAAPSAGALYPIELYVVASEVEELNAGLYHYQVSDSSLELLREGDLREELYRICIEQGAVEKARVNIIITARFARSTGKYSDRGYRYTYMECGAVCENIYLQATSLRLGTVAIGAFTDDKLNELLGIDGKDEAALLVMPVGVPD
jgi:SagB-type dehydrogenase family enzyme